MPSRSAFIQYHVYAWRRFRLLLIESCVVNYVLPTLGELLPWFLSRRHIAQRLRQTRSTIEHTIMGGNLPGPLLLSYLCNALLYSALCALDASLRDGVARRSRAVLERQLLQRLMSTDLRAIQVVYKRLYGIETRTDLVSKRISADLNLICENVNTTLPSAIRNLIVFVRSLIDIYPRRCQIDALAIVHPTLVAVTTDFYERFQQRLQPSLTPDHQAHDDIVANIVERLAEIQGANLQDSHLSLIDKVGGCTSWPWKRVAGVGLDQINKAISGHSVIGFASEMLLARRVMARAQIDHETYRKVQVDVNYSVNVLRKAVSLFRQASNGLEQSAGFAAILSLKTFRTSSPPNKKNLSFNSLTITNLYFEYDSGASAALNITTPITFERGGVYALLGPNGAGKSTMIRVLMKLLPPGPRSRLSVDGIPLTSIERYFYRRHITYVSQRPYLFPGTIAENVRIGHPTATDQQVEDAARLAGVFMFGNQNTALDEAKVVPGFAQLVTLAIAIADQSSSSNFQLLQQPVNSVSVSPSMAQAIALSRIFLSDQQVRMIVLDQPLTLLDTSKVYSFIWPNIREFARNRQLTIIVATHDPLVFEQADYVAVMEAGEIADYGRPNELLREGSSSYIRLLGVPESANTVVDKL